MSSQGQPSPPQANFYSQEWRLFSLLSSFLFPPDSVSQNVCVSCLRLCLRLCLSVPRTTPNKQRLTALFERFQPGALEWEAAASCSLHKRSPFVFQQNNRAFHREPGQPCCCCLEGCSHTSMHRSILIVLVCICHLGWVEGGMWDKAPGDLIVLIVLPLHYRLVWFSETLLHRLSVLNVLCILTWPLPPPPPPSSAKIFLYLFYVCCTLSVGHRILLIIVSNPSSPSGFWESQ